MLYVFSLILGYRMDGRNSSVRSAVRPQSLYCMCILHSRHFQSKPKHVHLYSAEPLMPVVAYHRARVYKSTDAKLIQ